MLRHLTLAASVALATSCGPASQTDNVPAIDDDAGEPSDGGARGDGGPSAPNDGGPDDGRPDGGAPDAGGSDGDGGPDPGNDAGPDVDGGPGDAGGPAGDGGPAPDAGGGGGGNVDGGMPDLIPDLGALQRSLSIEKRTFGADACVVEEACVGGPGERRLLRFATTTLNLGTADVRVGDPVGNPAFEYSPCHYHYHFNGFAAYRLLRADGSVAAQGHKQAFCLMDGTPRTPEAGPPQYHCDFQGLSVGWADTYDVVDCQWIDITGVPPGDYVVEIEVNPDGVIPELDMTNNTIRTEFTVPPDDSDCSAQPEICGDNIDQDCDGVADDGCPAITGNDTCGAAHMLVGDGVYRASLAGAGADVTPSCGGAGADVLFRLDLTVEEIVYVSTYGSDVDTTLSIFEGTCDGAGELTCADDGCGQVGEHFAGSLSPGTYFFAVKAKDPGATGEVQLKLQRSHCALAQALPDTSVVHGDTTGQADDERPVCAVGAGPDEQWYFTTCPGETPARFSTCGGASFNTLLELREGTCGSTGGVACSGADMTCDASGRAATLDVTLESNTGEGDGLWFLLVDGFAETDQGVYELSVDIGD